MAHSITEWGLSGKHRVPGRPDGVPWVGYVRVSTVKQQEEGASLDVQETAVRGFAKERGLDLLEVVRETRSAESIFGRPGLVDLLDATLRGEIAGVVVFCRDRLARDLIDRRKVVAPFKDAGRILEVHAVETDESADGKFLDGILALVEERERLRIAERTRVAVQAKIARGGAVGRAPFGFRFEPGVGQKDRFVPDPDAYPVYLRIRGWVAECLLSQKAMCEILNDEGVASPLDGAAGWTRTTMSTIVQRICEDAGWPTVRSERRRFFCGSSIVSASCGHGA